MHTHISDNTHILPAQSRNVFFDAITRMYMVMHARISAMYICTYIRTCIMFVHMLKTSLTPMPIYIYIYIYNTHGLCVSCRYLCRHQMYIFQRAPLCLCIWILNYYPSCAPASRTYIREQTRIHTQTYTIHMQDIPVYHHILVDYSIAHIRKHTKVALFYVISVLSGNCVCM
jgi:hypothetical protein